MPSFSMKRFGLAAQGLVLAGLLVSCSKKQAPPPQMPPPEVSVLTAQTEPISIITELPGRVSAVREAEVRARATGILLKRNFEEGATVNEGDVLFEIDPAPLEASLRSAQATLARAEAALKESQATIERYKELVKVNAISKQVYDEAVANLAQNEAETLVGKAAVQTAELNLGYAKVTAPITGRIGRALVTEGALVSAIEATQLAVIRQLTPVYLDITQSSTEMLRLRRAFENGEMVRAGTNQAYIKLILDDGSSYPHRGELLFSDVSVDPTTGMVTMRALFPNPDFILMPGMFARGQLLQGVITNSVVIPQRTLSRGAAGVSTVLVVTEQNQVEARPVEIAREVGNKAVIAKGLKPGERIIVEGSQKAPPGTSVRPVPYVEGGATNATPAHAAAGKPAAH
ncbi:MAG: efflux RND transporter periplasmic adaptor subunit [Verrucomicrobiales bacterium]